MSFPHSQAVESYLSSVAKDSREELDGILADQTPPTDINKALQRTKRCADLLTVLIDHQKSKDVVETDILKLVYETLFYVAYKQGFSHGSIQTTQKQGQCEVCVERRKRNRIAAAEARKRSRGEYEQGASESLAFDGI
jgi:hypothetical protein